MTILEFIKLPLEKMVPLAFALALLLLVLIGGLSYRSMKELRVSLEWENQTQLVLNKLEELLTTLVDAETSGRGFILSGEDIYLEPFNKASMRLPQQLAELRGLMDENPTQEQRLVSLERVAQELFDLIRSGIDMRRQQGLAAILDRPRTHRGKTLMDQLRQLIQELKQQELYLLQQRAATAQFGTNRTMRGILLGSAFGILTLALAGLAILREIGQRQRVERALHRAKLQLEAQVEEQTQALTNTAQELQLENIRRAKAEEAERRQREWWSVTLTSIGDAVITTDTQGRINYLNQTAQQLIGWTQEEAQGQPLAEVFRTVNEETLQPLESLPESLVDQVLSQGQVVRLSDHTTLLTKDGRALPIDNSGAPIRDVDGKILGAVLTFRDITDRKASENKVRLANQRFRLAEAASNGFVYDWNLLTNVVECSEGITNILGYQPDELSNEATSWLELIHPDDLPLVKAQKAETFATQEMCVLEYRVRHRDGHYVSMLDRALIMRDASGEPVRAVGSRIDITAAKAIEVEREQLLIREQAARQQAEEANRLKDEFVATISHELRAPLNSILGWARMLRASKLEPDTITKAVATIERSAENQARLIDDLLDISRIVTGKLRLDVRTIDPSNVVRSAIETVTHAAEAKDIKLNTELDPAVSFINGDSNRLQQVVWNLLSNAIKFTPRDGEVKIKLSSDESQVAISVSDTGQGIAPEFLPHVFDRFRQADSSSIRKHGGLGIGLAIVRHLVELHGGTVKAESAGDRQGATFTVYLPITPIYSYAPQSNGNGQHNNLNLTDTAKPLLDGLFILVVDDEEDTRLLLTQMLTAYGATVKAAGSAAEALEVILQQQPDLLVSDIGMPEEDGYSLIRKIRAQKLGPQGKIPAVALTAFARAQDRLHTLAAGFQHHVSKPVEPAELATVIASLTGRIGSENMN
jgi:PAS domain S-box-containing protein